MQIRDTLFKKNRALSLEDMSSPDNSESALQRFVEGRKRAGLRVESEGTECVDCFAGKGGALFVSLRELPSDASAKVFLNRTIFKKKSASLGGIRICCFWGPTTFCLGASYFDMPPSDNLHTVNRWCAEEGHTMQPCSFVQCTDLQLIKNHAKLAGGAIFVSGSKNPFSFCKNTASAVDTADNLPGSSCFNLSGNSVGVKILFCSFSWLLILVVLTRELDTGLTSQRLHRRCIGKMWMAT